MNIVIPICVSLVTLVILFLIYYIITVLIELRNTLVNVTKATFLLTREIERIDTVVSNVFEVVEKIKNVFLGSNFVILKVVSIIGSIISFFKRRKKGGVQNGGKK